jgi:hypothetical protein
MPYTREQMDELLGEYRKHMLTWEKADPGSQAEQDAAALMSSAAAALDDQMSHGAELPAAWLAGAPDQGEQPSWPRDGARRYLEARYGEGWVYKAPETISNVLERWIFAVARGDAETAEAEMLTIEEGMRQHRRAQAARAGEPE